MTLPAAYAEAHRGDPTRAYFWLLEIATTTPRYATDCDVALTWDGETWDPAEGVTMDMIRADDRQVVDATVQVMNVSNLYGVLISGLVGASIAPVVTIREAWVVLETGKAPAVQTDGVYIVCRGRLDKPTWDEDRLTFVVANGSDSVARTLPAPYYSTTCWYRTFKGAHCGYVGAATTCDRSLARCEALSNSARFGGLLRKAPPDGFEFWFGSTKHVVKTGGCT